MKKLIPSQRFWNKNTRVSDFGRKFPEFAKTRVRRPNPPGTKLRKLASKHRLAMNNPGGITSDYFRAKGIEEALNRV